MSVSITESPQIELAQVLAGGQAFLDRIATLTDAKARADAAVAELNLGKAAAVALEQAQQILADARIEAQVIKAEAERALERARQMVDRAENAGKQARAEVLKLYDEVKAVGQSAGVIP